MFGHLRARHSLVRAARVPNLVDVPEGGSTCPTPTTPTTPATPATHTITSASNAHTPGRMLSKRSFRRWRLFG